MRWSSGWFVFAVGLGVSGVAQAGPPADADALMERVESRYDDVEYFTATIRQTTVQPPAGLETVVTGTLQLTADGKQVWRFERDDSAVSERVVFVDGETMTVWEPASKSYCAIERVSASHPSRIAGLFVGRFDPDSKFDASVRDDDGAAVLSLVPKFAVDVAEVEFRVAEDGSVQRFDIFDAIGQRTTVGFESPETPSSLPDADFEFEPPADARNICE